MCKVVRWASSSNQVPGTRSSGSLRSHEAASRAGLFGRGWDGHSSNPAVGCLWGENVSPKVGWASSGGGGGGGGGNLMRR